MTAVKYAGVQAKKDALLRKPLNGGVHLAPFSATAPTLTTLFDTTSGDLNALPTGFYDLGYLTTDGAKFARSIKTSEAQSWGANSPTREDITSDEVTVEFTCQETNLHTVALWNGVDPSVISTTPTTNGAVSIPKPAIPAKALYRALVIGVDEDSDGETVIARFCPKVTVTAYADQSFQNGDTPLEYGFTITAVYDDTLAYSECAFFGGAGWLAKLTTMGFTLG